MTDEEPKKEKVNPQDTIREANAASERLEKANTEMLALLDRQAAEKAENALGGQTEAGIAPKELTDEDREVAAAKKLLAGTGYGDQLFPSTPKV